LIIFTKAKEEQYDSAKYYYEIAYELNSENENIVELARVASNMGQLYLETKKYEDSEKYLNEAISIFSKTNNGTDLSICFQQKAHLLFEKGKTTDAITQMNKALEFATDAKSNKHKIDIFKHLSKFYLKNKNYKAAYKNLELHTQLKDSIFSIEKTKALENITSIYEIEQKEQKIILLEKEKEINTFRNYILIGAIFILLFYWKKENLQTVTLKQNSILKKKNLQQTQCTLSKPTKQILKLLKNLQT